MDIDGDGNISLKELVNMGQALNAAEDQKKTYKKVIFFILFFAIAAVAATFLACLAAVEASKDSRPDTSGTMMTTSVTGKTKVVQTQQHIESVAITDLYKATYTTLDGVKNMGFQVGASFYAYTVTGFQQDLQADGTSAVRFYTSRGDTIYITSTASILELKSGSTIDISAAATLTRHLLSARDLLSHDGDGMFSGGSASLTTGTMDTMDTGTAAAMFNATSSASVNYTMSMPAGAEKLIVEACGSFGNAHPVRDNSSGFGCMCNEGFIGSISTYFNGNGFDTWGGCSRGPQPPSTNCWMNKWFTSGNFEDERKSDQIQCQCPWGTHKGEPKWDATTGSWKGACEVREGSPYAYGKLNFTLNKTWTGMDDNGLKYESYMHKCPATYTKGWTWYNADYDNNGNPTGTGKWDVTQCQPEQCPGGKRDNSTGPIDTCKCHAWEYGEGFKWSQPDAEEPWASGYWTPANPNYSRDDLDLGCRSKPMCPWNSMLNFTTGQCDCNSKYVGGHTFDAITEMWTGTCTPAPCPVNATRVWQGEGNPECVCMMGYTAKADGLWFSTPDKTWKGVCEPRAPCPANSTYNYMNENCACDVGYAGHVSYDPLNNIYTSHCTSLNCDDQGKTLTTDYCGGAAVSRCE